MDTVTEFMLHLGILSIPCQFVKAVNSQSCQFFKHLHGAPLPRVYGNNTSSLRKVRSVPRQCFPSMSARCESWTPHSSRSEASTPHTTDITNVAITGQLWKLRNNRLPSPGEWQNGGVLSREKRKLHRWKWNSLERFHALNNIS